MKRAVLLLLIFVVYIINGYPADVKDVDMDAINKVFDNDSVMPKDADSIYNNLFQDRDGNPRTFMNNITGGNGYDPSLANSPSLMEDDGSSALQTTDSWDSYLNQFNFKSSNSYKCSIVYNIVIVKDFKCPLTNIVYSTKQECEGNCKRVGTCETACSSTYINGTRFYTCSDTNGSTLYFTTIDECNAGCPVRYCSLDNTAYTDVGECNTSCVESVECEEM